VQLRGDRAVTTVALIRALGGGWDTSSKQVDGMAQASR
jgi:multidrug efflux system outer membrane protein